MVLRWLLRLFCTSDEALRPILLPPGSLRIASTQYLSVCLSVVLSFPRGPRRIRPRSRKPRMAIRRTTALCCVITGMCILVPCPGHTSVAAMPSDLSLLDPQWSHLPPLSLLFDIIYCPRFTFPSSARRPPPAILLFSQVFSRSLSSRLPSPSHPLLISITSNRAFSSSCPPSITLLDESNGY